MNDFTPDKPSGLDISPPSSKSGFRPLMYLLVLAAFFIITFLVGRTALIRVEGELRQSSGSALETVLMTTQEALYVRIASRLNSLATLAEDHHLVSLSKELLDIHARGLSVKDSEPLEAMREQIRPILERYGDQGYFLIAPDRISIGSMRDTNLDTVNLVAEQRTQSLDQIFAGEPKFIPTLVSDVPLDTHPDLRQPPTMFIGTPIRDQGKIIAVLTLRLNPTSNFSKVTQLGRLGLSGETYAFDKAGWLITESRFTNQLRRLGILRYQEQSALNVLIADPGGNMLKGFRPDKPLEQRQLTVMAQDAVQGRSGLDTDGYRDYRGVRVLGAWLWDDNLGFGLTTEIDEEEALGPYYHVRNTIVVGFGLAALLALFITMYLIRAGEILNIKVGERTAQLAAVNTDLRREVVDRVRAEERLQIASEELADANQRLEELAFQDGLTGVANRREFDNVLEREWRRCMRTGESISLILMDIDSFKAFNDTYGHQAGDDCLRKVGEKLSTSPSIRRSGDLAARYGGEEFAVILTGTGPDDALRIAREICADIRSLMISHEATAAQDISIVTLSAGVASLKPKQGMHLEELIHRADQALYEVKESGRNNAALWTEA